MSDQEPICDMLWLSKGEQDPFPDYVFRKREELPMAGFSDDTLANYAFMHYNRGEHAEYQALMSSLLEPQFREYPKIAFMTAVKERMRWLSRRLALAEGRYPIAKVYLPLGNHSKFCPPELFSRVESFSRTSDWDAAYLCPDDMTLEEGKAMLNAEQPFNGIIAHLPDFKYSGRAMLFEIPYTGPNNFIDFPNVDYTYRKPESTGG